MTPAEAVVDVGLRPHTMMFRTTLSAALPPTAEAGTLLRALLDTMVSMLRCVLPGLRADAAG